MAARLSSALLRTQSDPRLVALAAQGSEPAFEALVERYRRPLQAYCRRMLLPAEAAEDVVQQAFLSTWQALGNGTQVHDARAWLYRVAHNAAVNALKRSGYDHDQLDEALHAAGAPEEDLERRIAIRRTLAGLAGLPELQREALLRTAVEGRSHEDVARALGLTDNAVRGLVYRARATLRTAATALTPAPVVQWAASAGGSANAPLAERVADLVAAGGSAGAGALLMKGGATLLTAGALAGGAAVVEKERSDGRAGGTPAEARAAERGGGDGDAGPPRGGALSELALDDRSGRGRGARPSLDLDRDARSGRRRSGGDLGLASDDSSGPGGDDDSDNSGPGSDSSGSGSGSGDRDSSGPGSGDDDDGDNSGPGSGSSGSGSGSSGSGSSETDSSGSGSGSSDSGSGETDSSGSGSSGTGSGETDPSGSGSSGSGSGETDSSGSGSGETDSSGSDSSGSGSDEREGTTVGPAITTPDENP